MSASSHPVPAPVGRVRDVAGELDRAHLMLVMDDELLDAIDRDRELARRVA